jgi:hypothetical protein
MNKNLVYLGIGALALIGFYMYKQKQTATTTDLEKPKSSDEPQPRQVVTDDWDDEKIQKIKECKKQFKDEIEIKKCATEKGLDYDAYLMRVKAIKDSQYKGAKDLTKLGKRPPRLIMKKSPQDNEVSSFAFNDY